MQPEFLDRYAWMYVLTVVNNLGPFVRGITILRPEIRDWRMKTYLQMKWRGTHRGYIMKLTNHQYIYFWLKISKYSRPHVEIKFLKEQKKGDARLQALNIKMEAKRRLHFYREQKSFLQNNSLPQSKKTTHHNKCFLFFFYNFKRIFKKIIWYDKDCVAFFFKPRSRFDKKINK